MPNKRPLPLGLAALLLVACSGHPGSADAQAAQDQPTGLVPPTSASDFTANQLDAVLAGSWRSDKNRARDVYRHPKATLQFFGVRPDLTVIEITPGGGWYSEILAPLLRDNGHYIAAVARPSGEGEASRNLTGLRAKFAGDAERFGKAQVLEFDPKAPVFGAPGSADLV